jgi:SAM-dependent methyltransferase
MRDLALTWMETHYDAFGRLLDGVRAGEPAATLHYEMPFFAWLGGQPEQAQRFTGAMGNLTEGIKAHALAGYQLPAGELVADLGGADGSVLTMLLEDRRGIVFDLPHVIAASRERIARLGMTAEAGDFFERVPAADVYLLSMVLHDWDDELAERLLRSIATAARPGARVVALELVIPPGDGPHMAKMIDLTMLGMLTGRERTETEHAALFDRAGFTLDRVLATHSPMSIIEATLRG